jgi:pyrroline-5-carboxylate reductase
MVAGFAGSGNMAAAMARGWARGASGPDAMLMSDSGSGRAARLAEEVGGEAVDLAAMADRSDVVVLAVKPAALAAVGAEIAGRAEVVVSVLGATPLDALVPALAPSLVVRAMPNLAVEIGRGVICHCETAEQGGAKPVRAALELLSALGTLVEVDEADIDPATAVMGCAPAYLALAAEALIDAGTEAGLDPGLSRRLVTAAAAGTGEHLLSRDPGPMRAAIASPGGSTEAGLDELSRREVRSAFMAAVEASLERMRGLR